MGHSEIVRCQELEAALRESAAIFKRELYEKNEELVALQAELGWVLLAGWDMQVALQWGWGSSSSGPPNRVPDSQLLAATRTKAWSRRVLSTVRGN